MNRGSVDDFLRDGCGRCAKHQTPACKVHRWGAALVELRRLALAAGLAEELKWGFPCYTLGGKNVVMLAPFLDSCSLSFFEGAALGDDEGWLERAGPNSHRARQLRFRSREEVEARRDGIARYLARAVELERAGIRAPAPSEPDPVPEELARLLEADPALAEAFAALTPGRRRSHALHVSGAKQAATRERRAERCAPEILAGRGFQER